MFSFRLSQANELCRCPGSKDDNRNETNRPTKAWPAVSDLCVCVCVCGQWNINLFFKGPHSQRGNPSSSLVSNQKTQTQDLQQWRNVWGKICLYQGHISNCGSLKHINVLPLSGVSHVLWSYDAGPQMMGHITRSFHLCHRKYWESNLQLSSTHTVSSWENSSDTSTLIE